jgi:hypothetical protein
MLCTQKELQNHNLRAKTNKCMHKDNKLRTNTKKRYIKATIHNFKISKLNIVIGNIYME